MLFSEGFVTSKALSKKMTTLYYLMEQQLSKQDHYDFGLRSVKSVLNSAGALKRADSETGEDVILLRAIRDMNAPKFIAQDMPLFNALMSDLFPGVEPPVVDYGQLQEAIEAEMRAAGLQLVPSIIRKAIQTYESKLTRHGNMLVGASLGGKTTAWTVLSRAMTRLCKDGVGEFQAVKPYVINPKAVPSANLYGEGRAEPRVLRPLSPLSALCRGGPSVPRLVCVVLLLLLCSAGTRRLGLRRALSLPACLPCASRRVRPADV